MKFHTAILASGWLFLSLLSISAQTNGQVEAIYYDVDDVVKQGALLVKLKDTEQQAALRR
ncbi:biotin/lipoyl-binding protein, partial [Thiolapillus sp.]